MKSGVYYILALLILSLCFMFKQEISIVISNSEEIDLRGFKFKTSKKSAVKIDSLMKAHDLQIDTLITSQKELTDKLKAKVKSQDDDFNKLKKESKLLAKAAENCNSKTKKQAATISESINKIEKNQSVINNDFNELININKKDNWEHLKFRTPNF